MDTCERCERRAEVFAEEYAANYGPITVWVCAYCLEEMVRPERPARASDGDIPRRGWDG